MTECPACRSEPLVELRSEQKLSIELCRSCKGMLVDGEDLRRLAGSEDLDASTVSSVGTLALGPCLRCSTQSWQARSIVGVEPALVYACGACGLVWLLPGALERLRTHAASERWRARRPARSTNAAIEPAPTLDAASSSGTGAPTAAALDPFAPTRLDATGTGVAEPEPFDRVSFERGTANWLAAPTALVLALSFCHTGLGGFFGPLVAMPFHELGHALTSWLSSRFAVPLPFFTVWHEQRSVPFGLAVAVAIGAFGVRSWLERRRFGVTLALLLLVCQLALSWLVPARFTLMLQILGGGLGEIVLGALVLVAFHFPLPDRLRWDFWRWPALVPGSICLAHALVMWSRAVKDVRYMPWGAAVGDESDGDMNRLVNIFGWRAKALSSFYLKAALLSVAVLVAAQAWAWHRSRRAARQG